MFEHFPSLPNLKVMLKGMPRRKNKIHTFLKSSLWGECGNILLGLDETWLRLFHSSCWTPLSLSVIKVDDSSFCSRTWHWSLETLVNCDNGQKTGRQGILVLCVHIYTHTHTDTTRRLGHCRQWNHHLSPGSPPLLLSHVRHSSLGGMCMGWGYHPHCKGHKASSSQKINFHSLCWFYITGFAVCSFYIIMKARLLMTLKI